ncbi:4a-hydroxytetrahydrobiopterin dehydratase [Candidatus Pelagibacter ubique]|nr:4a-hydroxytetrahydrobiopterin dehydratase [Candidatus Pelagibacter ubique]
MTYLKKKKSLQCEVGVSKLDLSEIHKYKKKVVDWDVKSNEKKIYCLEKNYKFKNLLDSQNFVNKESEIPEKENHHPVLKKDYPKSLN